MSRVLTDSALARQLTGPDLGVTARAAPYRVTLALAVLACAAAPAYTVRWHIGFYPTTLLEVLIVVTVAAYAVETVRTRAGIPWRSPYTLAAALLLVAGLISILVSPDRRGALGLYRAYLLEPVVFFLVVSAAVRSATGGYLVLGGLAVGGLAAGLANSVVVLAAVRAHTLDLAVAPPVVIYNTANAVALYLVPLIAVAGAVLLHGHRGRLRLAAGAFVVLAGFATLLSFSRGGYAALVVIAVALALSHRWRWWLLGGVLVAAIVAVRLPFVATRIAHQLNASDPNNSLISRVKLWQATLQLLRDHPVLGSGLSGFSRTIGAYRGGVYEEQLIYPHNIVLNFWVETGLLGLVAFAWLLVQAVRTALRGWRECVAAWRPIELGIAIAVVAIVVHGMVDVPYWKNDLSLELWTLLALSWAGLRVGRAERA